MFLGLYNYTTYLTYLNATSGFLGIFAICLHSENSIWISSVFLLLSGICDMFDGVVSRTKKDRSAEEKEYGIQIDSLADLISFGLLPVLIVQQCFQPLISKERIYLILFCICGLIYVLTVLVRLACFNIKTDKKSKFSAQYFIGMPVTIISFLLPLLILLKKSLNQIFKNSEQKFFFMYLFCLILCSFLFVFAKIKFAKIKNIIYLFGLSLFLIFFIVIFISLSNL